jgi:hypothetical protein
VCPPVGQLLHPFRRHEGSSAFLRRRPGPQRGVDSDLGVLCHVGERHHARIEAGESVVQHAETEEMGGHDLPGDDACRSGVGVVQGSLQHGHELDLVHIHPLAPQLKVSDALFPQHVDDGSERIRRPVEKVWYDLRASLGGDGRWTWSAVDDRAYLAFERLEAFLDGVYHGGVQQVTTDL